MRESIGGAQLLIIIVTILLVIIVLLTASISYTKAFKARNAIINIVEKYAEPNDTASAVMVKAEGEIEELLKEMGYMLNVASTKDCPDKGTDDFDRNNNYNFCIYHFVDDENSAEHYGVLTYVFFELPIFGRNDRFVFPIYADTYSFRGTQGNPATKTATNSLGGA